MLEIQPQSLFAWRLFLPNTCSDDFDACDQKLSQYFKTDIFPHKIRCQIFIVLKDKEIHVNF